MSKEEIKLRHFVIAGIIIICLIVLMIANMNKDTEEQEFKEECEGDNFLFVFNMERLKERNMSLSDFEYITYLYMDDFYFKCPENFEDCFVYEKVICDESK